MTQGTGKRLYRACQRCRSRKTKCDLDSIGEPRKPPCLDCYRSGSQCVLAGSRRGGNFRTKKLDSFHPAAASERSPGATTDAHRYSSDSEDEANGTNPALAAPHAVVPESVTDTDLCGELRNPSDALQILAQSDDGDQSIAGTSPLDRDLNGPVAEDGDAARRTKIRRLNKPSSPRAIEKYELVERGIVSLGTIPELLQLFEQKYHPYCPIAPRHVLGRAGVERIGDTDFFLLTVMLTIATRDQPKYSMLHRHCWEHTQRLLLDVLLSHPWTQTPTTVQALLLLSEWLPHIQMRHSTSAESGNSFSEDRTAWSIIGQAVRHAYMLRLDRAAFRDNASTQATEEADIKRLIWAYVYFADRQISVRLGQSFWSRGPSIAYRLTAKDFSTLQPKAPGDEDFASMLQAKLEVTQILNNAHDILYSARVRTLALVFAGDYIRYLDDFQNAAIGWHTAWENVPMSPRIRNSLLLMYEYTCLYVNAFSFQAILTRTSSRNRAQNGARERRNSSVDPFPRGIMPTPEGRYVFDAIMAAKKILGIMGRMNPTDELRFLPSRFYLYGVYAAVFLYKAELAGARTAETEGRDTTSLVMKFVEVLSEAASSDQHIGYRYSRMIRKLWLRYEQRAAGKSPASEGNRTDSTSAQRHDPLAARHSFSGPSSGRTPLFGREDAGSSMLANGAGTSSGAQGGDAPSYGIPTPDLYDPDAALMNSQLFAPFAPELFSGSAATGDEFGAMQSMGNDGALALGAGGLNYFDPWGMPMGASNGSSWLG
ncbi:hypothetical protein NLU13_4446 [Sarocladium strictum]|uniref:Zn(2)-C6 fungal-type domain-containing protein n=1 Tax=Sarocladium strictum TaxID=5046 RepID=A0AA39L867_SARSR|nr:hypothetical protein NLU13_4446 [Sarocladium strictum]